MEKVTCVSCRHYRQHYIRDERWQYSPTADGHCVYPRLKMRKSVETACANFKPKDPPLYERRVFNIWCSVLFPKNYGDEGE